MALVTLSLGSNINPAFNIRQAVTALESRYGPLRVSPVYESEAVGFDGNNFLNLVIAMDIDDSLEDLAGTLKSIEDRQGRDRSTGRFSGRTLDIDILTFDDLTGAHAGMELPRPEITEHAFVLQPLADLLPRARHPLIGKTYEQLWSEFQRQGSRNQRLWQIPFQWQTA